VSATNLSRAALSKTKIRCIGARASESLFADSLDSHRIRDRKVALRAFCAKFFFTSLTARFACDRGIVDERSRGPRS
jgi:hypothetical protein